MSSLVRPSQLGQLKAIDIRRRRVLRKAERVVEMAQKASLIEDGCPKPPDWTEEEYRVAMDARQPARNAPYYLGMNQRIKENAEKHEVMLKSEAPRTLNIGTINMVAPRNYAVIDVEADPKK